MTRRAAFSQAEVERVVRALKAVGETIAGVESLPGGGWRVLTAAGVDEKPVSALEAWRRGRGQSAA